MKHRSMERESHSERLRQYPLRVKVTNTKLQCRRRVVTFSRTQGIYTRDNGLVLSRVWIVITLPRPPRLYAQYHFSTCCLVSFAILSNETRARFAIDLRHRAQVRNSLVTFDAVSRHRTRHLVPSRSTAPFP